MLDLPPPPHTPETLAERWQCSAQHVRNLFRRGELRGFRIGTMIRIPQDAVEEFEKGYFNQPKSNEALAAQPEKVSQRVKKHGVVKRP